MQIRDKQNGKTIAKIVTNQSMTLDEAMSLAGYTWETHSNDTGWLVGGIYYGPDDLEMVYGRGRPPKYGEPMTQVAIYLTTEQIAWLDERDENRSETIRSLIDSERA